MECKNCNQEVAEGEKFCSSCGKAVDFQSTSSAYCPQCGTKAEQGSAFCYDCGHSFNQPVTFESNPGKQKHQFSAAIRQSSGNKQIRNIAIIILAIILLITVAIIIWFKNDPNAKEKLTNTIGGIIFIGGFIWYVIRKKGRSSKGGGYDWDDDRDHYDTDDNDYDDGGDDD